MGDIYDDLENYEDFSNLEMLKNENEELKALLKSKESDLLKLKQDILQDFDTLQLEHQRVLTNYSTFLKTARAEIQRKADNIIRANKEKDELFFRLKNIPAKKNNRNPAESNSEVPKSIESNKKINKPLFDTPAERKQINRTLIPKTENQKTDILPKSEKNVLSDKDKENLEEIKRPASIAARRKSLPASRFEASKLNSDDEDRVTISSHKSKDDIDRPKIMDIEKPKFTPGVRYIPDNRYNEPPRHDIMYKDDRFRRGNYVEQLKYKDRKRNFDPRYRRSRRDDFRLEYRAEHRQRDRSWDSKPENYRARVESPPRESWADHHRPRGHSGNRTESRHSRGDSPSQTRPENRRLRDSPPRDVRLSYHRPRTNSPRDFIAEHNRSRGNSPPRDVRLGQHQRFRADSPSRDKPEHHRSRGNSSSRDMWLEARHSRPESPERNKYNRTKSRDRRNIPNTLPEKPRQLDELKHRNDEIEEPMTKRRRVDSVHNNTPESSIDVVGEPQGHFSPSQLNTCQSPDETHADVCTDQTPVKEIMSSTNTELDDPRLTSSQYHLVPEEKNKFRYCTMTGRDVHLKILQWGSISKESKKTSMSGDCYSLPHLLKEPPTDETLSKMQQTQDRLSDSNSLESGELDKSLQDVYSDLISSGDLAISDKPPLPEINELPVATKPTPSIEEKQRTIAGKYKIPKHNKDVLQKQSDETVCDKKVSCKQNNAEDKDKQLKDKGKWSVAGDLELSDDSESDDKPIRKLNKSKGQGTKNRNSEVQMKYETLDDKNEKAKDIREKMCDLFGDSSLITPEDLNIPSGNENTDSHKLSSILDEGNAQQGEIFNELSKDKPQSPRAYIKSSAEESNCKKDAKSHKRYKNKKNEGTKPKSTLELKTELYVVNISNDHPAPDEKTESQDLVNELLIAKKPETAHDRKQTVSLTHDDNQRKHDKLDKKKKRNKTHEKVAQEECLKLDTEETELKNELQMANTACNNIKETINNNEINSCPDVASFHDSVVNSELSTCTSTNTTLEADSSVNSKKVLDTTERSEESMNAEGSSAPDVRIIIKSRRRKRKLP